MSEPSQGEFKFQVNEMVLCFHGPLLYDAKILKAEVRVIPNSSRTEPGPCYRIHYKGWKASYDEWVLEDRVRKDTEENRQKQVSLKEELNPMKRKKVAAKAPVQSQKNMDISQEEASTKKKPVGRAPASKPMTSKAPNVMEKTPSESSPQKSKPDPKSVRGKSIITTKGEVKLKKNKGKEKEGAEEKTDFIVYEINSNIFNKEQNQNIVADKSFTDIDDVQTSTRLNDESIDEEIIKLSEVNPIFEEEVHNKMEKGKKRKPEEFEDKLQQGIPQETKEVTNKRPEVPIPFPESLKTRLIDDWDFIINQNKIVPLPRDLSINEILESYVTFKSLTPSHHQETPPDKKSDEEVFPSSEKSDNLESLESEPPREYYQVFADGIIKYFNKTISPILLYASEREQLFDIQKDFVGKELSEIYGAEHLLRLLIKMPSLLAYSKLDEESVSELNSQCQEFLRYLDDKEEQHRFFVKSYIDLPSVEPAPKKRRTGAASWKHIEGLVCANCGTADTPGWRAGSTPDEKLCNACGLYYVKHKRQRPQQLWGALRTKKKF